VVVDYGHNAAALDATGAMIAKVWGGEPAAAVTLPGDRRDDLLTETAEAVAAWFGKVVVYEDSDLRGRRPGEMQDLICAAMRRVRPDIVCERAAGPEQALRGAVALAGGAPVLLVYEKLAAARDAVAAIGAVPWPDQGGEAAPPGGPGR
jgi:cyanophycin synthetase